jgi:hypothetical protein
MIYLRWSNVGHTYDQHTKWWNIEHVCLYLHCFLHLTIYMYKTSGHIQWNIVIWHACVQNFFKYWTYIVLPTECSRTVILVRFELNSSSTKGSSLLWYDTLSLGKELPVFGESWLSLQMEALQCLERSGTTCLTWASQPRQHQHSFFEVWDNLQGVKWFQQFSSFSRCVTYCIGGFLQAHYILHHWLNTRWLKLGKQEPNMNAVACKVN